MTEKLQGPKPGVRHIEVFVRRGLTVYYLIYIIVLITTEYWDNLSWTLIMEKYGYLELVRNNYGINRFGKTKAGR